MFKTTLTLELVRSRELSDEEIFDISYEIKKLFYCDGFSLINSMNKNISLTNSELKQWLREAGYDYSEVSS